MLTLTNLSLRLGGKLLLNQANLSLHPSWKLGLTGANGTGKTSFFKLLLGKLTPDAGQLQMQGFNRLAYMQQEVAASEETALDFVLSGFERFTQLEEQLAAATLAEDNQQLAHLYSEYDLIDGYSQRNRAEQLLAGLGFQPEEINQPVASFSGGWRLRLSLAKALFMPSDLLLLDEPTNHLDLDALLWLEAWLKAYSGTLILISHDRDFLDAVTSHTLHFYEQKLDLYTGNYSAFERQRAEKLALHQANLAKQEQQVAHLEAFIRRFKAKASKAKQAQSRIKTLEKMQMLAPARIESPFRFEFADVGKVSSPLIQLEDASLGYEGKALLEKVNLALYPAQRVGILGANGAGKTTLLESLAGKLSLVAGQLIEGANLKLGYFAQQQVDALDLSASPLLHLQRLKPTASEQEIRNFLGGFAFTGDTALGSIEKFSGGEKARLALAILVWQEPNLLLLDEPTNHLDLDMREALSLALQDFEGALLIISHDRHLLNACVDEFCLVNQGKVGEFDLSLNDYPAWLAEEKAKASKPANTDKPQVKEPVNRREQRQLAEQQRALLRPLKNKLKQLEKELEITNQKLAAIEEQLADTEIYNDPNQKEHLTQLIKQQAQLAKQQEELEEAWLETSEELEAAE